MNKIRHLAHLLKEIWAFAGQNKSWWLVPVMFILLIVAGLIVSGQIAAPFIYTLF